MNRKVLNKASTLFIILIFAASCHNIGEETILSGKYPSPDLPGNMATLFSPGFINTGMITRDVSMTPDMDELYFSVATLGHRYSTIMYTRKIDNKWVNPERVPYMDDLKYFNFEPCVSPDGNKLFFLSSRPDPANNKEGGNQDIWVMEREGEAWGEPYNLGEPVSTDAQEYYPSVTKDGTLYFTRTGEDANYIYRSRLIDGEYQEPELLPGQVNCGRTRFNAFISPDEDYIIVPATGMAGSIGESTDYYIVFRDIEDNWSDPINMGEKVNSKSNQEFSASVSPDGSTFFFMSAILVSADSVASLIPDGNLMKLYSMPQTGNSNIYWMRADFIESLRDDAVYANQ